MKILSRKRLFKLFQTSNKVQYGFTSCYMQVWQRDTSSFVIKILALLDTFSSEGIGPDSQRYHSQIGDCVLNLEKPFWFLKTTPWLKSSARFNRGLVIYMESKIIET